MRICVCVVEGQMYMDLILYVREKLQGLGESDSSYKMLLALMEVSQALGSDKIDTRKAKA